MAKNYTANFKEKTGSTVGEEALYLLEITHTQLGTPVRIVNDTQDIVSNGNTFTACAFRVQLPEEITHSMPRVSIAVDNIGRELTLWLDGSKGGRGGSVRIMQIMRDTPNTIEQEYTLSVIESRQDMMQVVFDLGYENVLDVPALVETYNPENTPGIF